jgi:hypothetical protein
MKNNQKNSIALKKEDFSFVCPLKTEDMNAVEGGYFCQKCEKKVHDVTHMQHEDFQALKAKSENLCVTIHKVAAVSLVLGLSACASPQTEQRLVGKISTNVSCDANVSVTPRENRLTPFTAVDKNQTININRVEEPQIAGGISAYVPPVENNSSQEK